MAPDTPATERELQPARERRALSLEDVDAKASGKPGEGLIFKGHAAVFGRRSLDLGGFTEVIAPGAFKKVLDSNPDVRLVWDHDGQSTLARTSGKYLLDLREDPRGLHFYANAAPTSYAKDLAILMDGGTIDQGSFAFSVARGGDSWEVGEDETVTRTIHEVDGLYDVTITGQGAYPQTDTTVVMRSLEAFREATAVEIPEFPESPVKEDAGEDAEPEQPDGEDQREVAETESPGTDASLDEVEGEEERVRELKAHTRVELELAKRRLLEAERK
jgi:hypothetical protein